MEIICKTNISHEFCGIFKVSKPSEAIVPEIMEIMEIIGFTNRFHEFGGQNHGNHL